MAGPAAPKSGPAEALPPAGAVAPAAAMACARLRRARAIAVAAAIAPAGPDFEAAGQTQRLPGLTPPMGLMGLDPTHSLLILGRIRNEPN